MMEGKNDELTEEIKRFSEYGNFQLVSVQKSIAKKVYNTYLRSLRAVRGTYLIAMSVAKASASSEYKAPVRSLLKSIFTEPTRVFMAYSPMFNQRLSYSMQMILSKPAVFGKIAANYFKDGDNNLIEFAWTTFPSVFGYFIGAEFCEAAVSFLESFFHESQNVQTSTVLFSSFFCCCHGFYESLWMNLANGLAKLPLSSSTFFQILKVLEEALSQSLPFLSKYHIDVLSRFCEKYPPHCSKMFVKAVLIQPFIRVSSASAHFTSEEQITVIRKFLDELISPLRTLHVERILDVVIAHESKIKVNPSMKHKIWSREVPFMLNDCDVNILVDMFSKPESEMKLRIGPQDGTLTNDLRPLIIDVFPKLGDEIECKGVSADIFGITPPHVPSFAENDESFDRVWRKMVSLAKENCIDTVEFVLPKICNSNDGFSAYCKGKILELFRDNFFRVNETILIVEHLSRLQNLYERILGHNVSLYHAFAFSYFKRKFAKKLGLAEIMSRIYEIVDPPKRVRFELASIAMDCTAFPVSKDMVKAERKFMGMVNRWMEHEWPQVQSSCGFTTRTKYILDASTLLSHIDGLGLGKRLKVLVEFEARLKDILGKPWDNSSDWLTLFIYSLFASQSPQILEVFLTFHHFVFNTRVANKWPSRIIDAWTMFSTGMWYVLKQDPPFCSFCSDYKQCHALFHLEK